jgi:ABC-type uncharacterized transport system ATPase subunit
MIEARGLVKHYRSTLAVDNLSFDVRPGTVTGFLGPNGAGKPVTELRHSLLAPGGLSLTWPEAIFSDAPTVLDILRLPEVRDALTR